MIIDHITEQVFLTLFCLQKRAAMKHLLETEVRRLERLLPGLASTQGQETEQPDMVSSRGN